VSYFQILREGEGGVVGTNLLGPQACLHVDSFMKRKKVVWIEERSPQENERGMDK